MAEIEAVRRWMRVLGGLRAQALKVRRPDATAAAALDEILTESLAAGDSLLHELAGAHLDAAEVRRQLQAEARNRQYLFEQIPVACVATDRNGVVLAANQPAAELFNVSPKHLRGRMLLLFAAEREAFSRLLATLPADGDRLRVPMPIRPRERGLTRLNALIVSEGAVEPSSWLWFLTDAAAAPAPAPGAPAYSEQDLV
jgi:PAS domain-containing protein